jgi:hypothetical protein
MIYFIGGITLSAWHWFTPDKIEAIATVVYALVTIVMFLEIRSQSKAALDQAGIAKDAAIAAKRSADALVASKRAWVFGKVEPFSGDGRITPQREDIPHELGVIKVVYSLDNYGSTPACITAFGIKASQFDSPEEAVIVRPDYGQKVQMLEYIVPGKPLNNALLMNPNDFILINQKQKFLVICGIVEYLDVFGEAHTTEFCFEYHVPHGFDLTPVGFYRFGGKGRNRQT